MSIRRLATLCLVAAAVLATTSPAHAGSVTKTVPFELEKWWQLDSSDGPLTLHRIQIDKMSGPFDKSALFRPGNSQYPETVQIKLEYTNESKKGWDAHLTLVWKGDKGEIIDGYSDDESLDNYERNEFLSTTTNVRSKQLFSRVDADRRRDYRVRYCQTTLSERQAACIADARSMQYVYNCGRFPELQ
jgi:hypothetical protein